MKKKLFCCGLLLVCAGLSFSQERFRKTAPIPDPLQQLQLPAIESVQLSNGLTVAVVYRRNLPYIAVELTVLAGESASPENMPGLATFAAEMLCRGTSSVSASEIEDRVESIGGSLDTVTSLDDARFSFLFLDEYLDQALEILSLMILQPGFSDREIANLKRIQYYDILQKQREPEFVGEQQLRRLLFKSHPYQNAFHSEDVIKNINKKELLAFYDKFYRPNNAVVVLAGNLNLTTASRKVSHYLNTWQRGDLNKPASTAPQPNSEERVCLVDFPGAKEATLLLGNTVFSRIDPDFFPFSVLNQVLGGTPNSRLFMNLRESKEYAYFAFSKADFWRGCGVFAVRAKVVPSACSAAVQEILRELERMTKEKVSTFEIEQAKSYLIGNFPLQIAKLDDLTRHISDIVTYSLGDSYWNKFYENVQLVDVDRVFAVAQKYLLKPIVVIVGDKSLLLEILSDYEKLEVYDAKGTFLYTLTKGEEE